jgi:hypothetical protein
MLKFFEHLVLQDFFRISVSLFPPVPVPMLSQIMIKFLFFPSWDNLRSNTSARRYVSKDGTSSSNPPRFQILHQYRALCEDELTLGFPKVLPSSSQLYIYTSRYVLRLLRSSSTTFLHSVMKSLLKCRKLGSHSFFARFNDILLTLHSFILL